MWTHGGSFVAANVKQVQTLRLLSRRLISIGDKIYEVREKHNIWKVLMQRVKTIEMNLSLLKKQPEVSLEVNRTLMLVGKSKKEITEWKGKMEKELRDLELWKTLVISRVESLARGNNALRIIVY